MLLTTCTIASILSMPLRTRAKDCRACWLACSVFVETSATEVRVCRTATLTWRMASVWCRAPSEIWPMALDASPEAAAT